jgi:hypothetical protein
LTAIAMLYTVPQKVRSEMGIPDCRWISCQVWITRDRRIVVPMFVPANCHVLVTKHQMPKCS